MNTTAVLFHSTRKRKVNAVEMAKPFGKQPAWWLRTQAAQDFIKELSDMRKCISYDNVNVRSDAGNLSVKFPSLIKIVKGGTVSEVAQGTWFHEDVAIEFARWLSPAFAIWCNDRIKELAKYGITATQPAIDTILSDPDNAIKILTALKEERAAKERLEVQTAIQQKEIEKAAPKVEYFDRVMQSSTVYTTTQVAKEFGMGAKSFNKLLREKKLVFQQNGQWLLYAPHDRQGYTKTRTYNFFREDGTPGTSTQTVWTEKGREWLHRIMKDKNAHGVYVSLPHARVATIATQM